MPDVKPKPTRKRGPVDYLAFAQIGDRWFLLFDDEAANVYELRKLLVQRHGSSITFVIIPKGLAHIVEHEREEIVKERFKPAGKLLVGFSFTPPAEPAHLPNEGGLPLVAPEELDPAAAAMAERAAAAAHAAEAAARSGQVMPVDPDDDDLRNPDTDPETGLSRRKAAEATSADEASVIFPVDE